MLGASVHNCRKNDCNARPLEVPREGKFGSKDSSSARGQSESFHRLVRLLCVHFNSVNLVCIFDIVELFHKGRRGESLFSSALITHLPTGFTSTTQPRAGESQKTAMGFFAGFVCPGSPVYYAFSILTFSRAITVQRLRPHHIRPIPNHPSPPRNPPRAAQSHPRTSRPNKLACLVRWRL